MLCVEVALLTVPNQREEDAAESSSRMPATNLESDRSPLRAELDGVGVSFGKAGTADHISVQSGVDEVKLLGPPREHPRRSWLCPEWQRPLGAGTAGATRMVEPIPHAC
jgi:hypothetical protein